MELNGKTIDAAKVLKLAEAIVDTYSANVTATAANAELIISKYLLERYQEMVGSNKRNAGYRAVDAEAEAAVKAIGDEL